MKKKIVALMLGAMLAITAAGCGGRGNENVESTETAEGTETAEVTQTVAASKAFDLNAKDYVTLCNYEGIEVTINGDYEVGDEDITDYLTEMFTYYGPFYMEDTTKTTIEEGDIVNVDYVGKLDGEAFEGGSAEGQMIDVYNNTAAGGGNGFIEGFTDGLKGASVGDVIDSNVTFPEDYGNADLAGQGVVFTFTVNSIQKERTIDDLDDAFAKEQFQAESVEDMHTQIRSFLESSAEYNKRSDTYSAIQNYLLENCTVEVPEDYLAARVGDFRTQFIQNYCEGDESQLETYLSTYYGKTVAEAEEEWKSGMQNNIKLEFIMETIAEAEGITLDEDEYTTYIQNLIANNGYESEEALYEMYGYGDVEFGEKYLKQIFVDNKALEIVQEKAIVTVEEKTEDAAGAAEGTETQEGTEAAGNTESTETE